MSVLVADGVGGFFEVTAVGMSRDEVLAVADGVQRVSVEDFLDLGSEVSWDLQTAVIMTRSPTRPQFRREGGLRG